MISGDLESMDAMYQVLTDMFEYKTEQTPAAGTGELNPSRQYLDGGVLDCTSRDDRVAGEPFTLEDMNSAARAFCERRKAAPFKW